MSRRRRPQILPTRYLRRFVQGGLRVLDHLPLTGSLMRPKQSVESSDFPVTLVMPLHVKDMWIAPYSVKQALKNIKHPIEEVVVVSAPEKAILDWVSREGYRHVDENAVLGYGKEAVEPRMPEHAARRGGWIFQQLLKFAADCQDPGFVVVDSDTLLLVPWVFKSGDTIWIDFSHEKNLLYLKSYRKLTGETEASVRSLVCHHMFGETDRLKALKERIESRSGKPWDDTIIELAADEMWTESEKGRNIRIDIIWIHQNIYTKNS